jgi:hypothetical protein
MSENTGSISDLTEECKQLRAENDALRRSLAAAEDHLSALLNERETLRSELGY